MKIILDTNFLVYCAKQKIDYKEKIGDLVSGEYILVTLDQVINELKGLGGRKGVELALILLKRNKIRIVKGKGRNADESIIKISEGNIVATLDRKLRKEIWKNIVIGKNNQLKLL